MTKRAVSSPPKMDLVIEGGAMFGIAEVGAYSLLAERGYIPQNIAGTSAGAIVGALIACGYTSDAMRHLLTTTPFSSFTDQTWLDTIPLIGMPLNAIEHFGIYKGDALLAQLRSWFGAQGKTTFGDLRHPDFAEDEPRYRYRLQVIAADLTARRMLVLPRDADLLGIDPDALEIALAVRMSASIPIFFQPVRHRNPQTGVEHVIVDGGLLSNFPIWLFDSATPPTWPTFGIRLVNGQPRQERGASLPEQHGPHNIIEYAQDLVGTLLEGHDRMYMDEESFVRTIAVPTLGLRGTDFAMSSAAIDALYTEGRAQAEQFLAGWNFARYVRTFRAGTPRPSRRARVVAALRQPPAKVPAVRAISLPTRPDTPLSPPHSSGDPALLPR